MEPTTAHTIQVVIAGEPRTLKYGFRAFKELGLNPFKPQTLIEFFSGLDVEPAAKFIRAGLLHEYCGKNAPRKDETPPTVDEIIDDVDMDTFMASIQSDLAKIVGADERPSAEGSEGATPDPPQA